MVSRRSFLVMLAAIWSLLTRRLRSLLGATPPASRAPRRIAGLGCFNFTAANIARLRRLGITRTRTTLYWQSWVDTRHLDTTGRTVAQEQEAALTATLNACDAAGIAPVIVVHSPPVEASHTLAWGIATMPAFMAGIAGQFRGRIWQIMNEMDGEPAFNGQSLDWFGAHNKALSQSDRGALYGQLLGPVYDAIKRADPTATVITGGIALEPVGFYAGLKAKAAGKCDAVAVHCYANPGVPAVMRAKSIAMRAVLGRVPLWCTEWGSNLRSEADQASEIGAALDDNDISHRYDRHYLFQLDDATEGYGLVNADGSLRAAAELLVNRRAG